MLFFERLKSVRTNKGCTQRAVADVLRVSERAYQHYEAGSREPNISTLIALADYFEVSVDYLVGRIDEPAP